jgi:hypothetical protein
MAGSGEEALRREGQVDAFFDPTATGVSHRKPSIRALLQQMARYFFDFRSGGAVSHDEDGVDLPDANRGRKQSQLTVAKR